MRPGPGPFVGQANHQRGKLVARAALRWVPCTSACALFSTLLPADMFAQSSRTVNLECKEKCADGRARTKMQVGLCKQ